jgi:diaminopimelate epimerase
MIPFAKMAGCGNDFVLIEASDISSDTDLSALGRAVCTPGTGLGADGLVVLRRDRIGAADFSVRIINRSGLPAEMCGNAARCIARHAVSMGFAPAEHSFLTDAGSVSARVRDGGYVEIGLPDPSALRRDMTVEAEGQIWTLDAIDIGVPHAVLWWDDIESAPVGTLGMSLRHAPAFPAGANINFAAWRDGRIRVRTFERGVEAETLACGTGSTASAISAQARGITSPPTEIVTTEGGILTVGFKVDNDRARHVTLSGPTTYVAEGRLADEWLSRRR